MGLDLDIFKSARAPVLRNLDVCELIPWRALERVAFPWSQVTSIMSFPAFDPDGLNRLRTLVNLEVLSVVATSNHTPIDNLISLPNLRCLTITESENATGRNKDFFSVLATPVLSELTLIYPDESVLHFPTLPLPLEKLVKLDITCEMTSHKENTQYILDFLALTHHVEYLRLHDINITVDFCDGLNLDKVQDGLPARLPCLRVLDIGDSDFACTLNLDVDPFFDMIYSRLPETETVDDPNTGTNGDGQSAVSNETDSVFDPGSRLNSGDHRTYLKMLRFPRWLYIQTREWEDTFLTLISMVELQSGVITSENS